MSIDLRPIAVPDVPKFAELVSVMLHGTMFEPPTLPKVERIAASRDWFVVGGYDGEKMVAFMAGVCSETFLNSEFNAYEKGLFVLPEYRKSGVARMLVEAFEKWARGSGASKCWIGQSVNQDRDGVLKFFESLGYECQGFITCKKL